MAGISVTNGTTLSSGTVLNLTSTEPDSNYSSVVIEKIDPNAAFPPLVNIGVPILVIILFIVGLVLVYAFPNKDDEETIIERMFPEKGAKTRRRRRARTNSHRLEEQEV